MYKRQAEYYYQVARGIDERPVKTHRQRKSIGKETTFESNIVNKRVIWTTLEGIAEKLEDTLKDKKFSARTITLKAKYSDFQLITRSKTDDNLFQSKEQILDSIPELLKKTDIGKRPIRLIGISLAGLITELDKEKFIQPNSVEDDLQISLFK